MAGPKGFSKLKWYYQILAVAAVCGGLLGVFWYFVLSPTELEIAVKTKQVMDLQAQIDKSRLQKAALEKFKRDSAELEAKLEQLKSVLPQDREIDQVLRQVNATARASGLRIQRDNGRNPIDHEVYTEWPRDMEVVGTYHNIGTFLDKIRQLPRIVNISNLRIQTRASEGEVALSASVGATYTATTFVYKEEIAATAPPAKAEKEKK